MIADGYTLIQQDPYRKTTKLISGDRVFKLSLKDEKSPISSTGLLDRRLFSGQNRIHAKHDSHFNMWYMVYEHGTIPEALDQRFTTFRKLYDFMETYFDRRNVKIEEVLD